MVLIHGLLQRKGGYSSIEIDVKEAEDVELQNKKFSFTKIVKN